jgi:hypothetical protein
MEMKDFLQTSEPRTLGMMLVAVVLLASAVLITYLLWPQIKAFNAINDSQNIMLNTVNSSEGLEQQIMKVKAEVDSLMHQLHGDMARLPDKQLESYIIGRLQKISWETDVELISVMPDVGQRVQMFRESLFEVEINAGYFDFFRWLQAIGNELGFIVVKKYEIHLMDKELHDPKLKIVLTMVSYRRVES